MFLRNTVFMHDSKIVFRQDQQSIAFVAEELDSDEYPELLFWRGKQTVSYIFYNRL